MYLIILVSESKPSSESYDKVVSQIPKVDILIYLTKEGMVRRMGLHCNCKIPFLTVNLQVYRILQNFRNLNISQIAAKMGCQKCSRIKILRRRLYKGGH